MSALTKAQLGEITSGDHPSEVPNTLVDVQFNPTTLRVQISNKTAGGQQAGAQARQRPGTGEMQVSFDLVYDTADEGSTDQGVSVLDKTKMVERFVRPKGNRAGQEAPPRVIFKWGSFLVQGTMESANIDLDLFDAKGVPLRAKVAVTIKGQDPRWTYTPAPNPQPPGSATGASSTGPATGLSPGAPGTQGNNAAPDRIMQAMPGESLAQLAQRAGLDPKAWRALADGLANPLKLELGQEVPLPSSTNKGMASAAGSQDPGKTAASLPLVNANQATPNGAGSNDAARNSRDLATDPVRKGQAVVTRGGVRGAIAVVKGQAHQQGATTSLHAFGVASGETADNTERPWGAGVPLRPRFDRQLGAIRRDPPQAAWIAQPATPPSASTHPKNPTPNTARSAVKPGCGCGCRGRKSRPSK
jgi:hypothetical protein